MSGCSQECSVAPGSRRQTAVSFDDVLGEPSQRYFASGYKRVEYSTSYRPVLLGERGQLFVEGVASAAYPLDWSMDATGAPRMAHVSSIDALVLGAATIEHASEMFPDFFDASTSVVDRVSIRAGRGPLTDLQSVRVAGSVTVAGENVLADLNVGSLSLRFELGLRRAPRLDADAIRPYWEGYRATSIASYVIDVDVDERSMTTQHLADIANVDPARGLDSDLWPGLTHIDNVVIFGQIAQILVQLTEGVARGTIDNLWMRRMGFTRTRTRAQSSGWFEARARIIKHDTIARGGRSMHSLELEAQSDHGVDASAVFGFVTIP